MSTLITFKVKPVTAVTDLLLARDAILRILTTACTALCFSHAMQNQAELFQALYHALASCNHKEISAFTRNCRQLWPLMLNGVWSYLMSSGNSSSSSSGNSRYVTLLVLFDCVHAALATLLVL
jgi:hypothetical protein